MSDLHMKRPRILILNASLAGEEGNTAVALERVRSALVRGGKAEVRVVVLAGATSESAAGLRAKATGPDEGVAKSFAEVKEALAWAEGFIFGTGTHWDSWSSVLQTFLEDSTEAEGTKVWLGKPAACVVTEHSVGGKGVLSRLQGVLVTLGCLIPPMSGVVLSKVAQIAAGRSAGDRRGLAKNVKNVKDAKVGATSGDGMGEGAGMEDFWGAEDLTVVAHNLVEAVKGTRKWKVWAVDREEFEKRWIE